MTSVHRKDDGKKKNKKKNKKKSVTNRRASSGDSDGAGNVVDNEEPGPSGEGQNAIVSSEAMVSRILKLSAAEDFEIVFYIKCYMWCVCVTEWLRHQTIPTVLVACRSLGHALNPGHLSTQQ